MLKISLFSELYNLVVENTTTSTTQFLDDINKKNTQLSSTAIEVTGKINENNPNTDVVGELNKLAISFKALTDALEEGMYDNDTIILFKNDIENTKNNIDIISKFVRDTDSNYYNSSFQGYENNLKALLDRYATDAAKLNNGSSQDTVPALDVKGMETQPPTTNTATEIDPNVKEAAFKKYMGSYTKGSRMDEAKMKVVEDALKTFQTKNNGVAFDINKPEDVTKMNGIMNGVYKSAPYTKAAGKRSGGSSAGSSNRLPVVYVKNVPFFGGRVTYPQATLKDIQSGKKELFMVDPKTKQLVPLDNETREKILAQGQPQKIYQGKVVKGKKQPDQQVYQGKVVNDQQQPVQSEQTPNFIQRFFGGGNVNPRGDERYADGVRARR